MNQNQANENRYQQATRITWKGFLVNCILAVLKLAGGIIGRSAAMVADAVHSLSDLATDIVVILSFRVVRKPIDESHNFGHGKFETLSTTFIGLALSVVGGGIFYAGAREIYLAYQGVIIARPGLISLLAAIISIAAKETLFHYTLRLGKKINSQTIIANAWHHRSDVLSSIGTFIGIAGAIFLGEKWRILDPIAAVMVSFFIFKVAIEILKESVDELMEAAVDDKLQEKILSLAAQVEGALNPHDLKTRRIGHNIAVDLHINVKNTISIVEAHDISTEVEKQIRTEFGADTFVSVHVEPLG